MQYLVAHGCLVCLPLVSERETSGMGRDMTTDVAGRIIKNNTTPITVIGGYGQVNSRWGQRPSHKNDRQGHIHQNGQGR